MKWILYNPEKEDFQNIPLDKAVIIDMKDRYPNGINFNDKKQEYRRKSQLWLQEWSKTKIGGVTIREYFSKDDQTYFYLLSYFFQRYFEKEGFLFKNSTGFQLTLMIADLLDQQIDDDVYIISRDPHVNHFVSIAEKICFKKGKNAIVIKKPYTQKGHNIIRKNPDILKNLIKARILIRWFSGAKGFLRDKEKGKVVFLSSFRFSRKKDVDNVIFGNIIKSLDVPYKIINYDPPDPVYIKKLMFNSYLNNYLGDYYTLKILRQNDSLTKEFKKKWLNIRRSPELIRSFYHSGINLYSEIEPWFDLIFDSIFYLIADCINITRNVIDREKPSCIIIDHEENFYGKGLMINAKKTRTPIIALQHEAILPDDSNHFHIKEEDALNKDSINWRPLPDKKCVGDEKAKEILINKCNYTADRIVVTGRPEYDDLMDSDFDIQESKITILYAVEYYENTKRFLEATKDLSAYKIIIKPHPESRMKDYKKLCSPYNVTLVKKTSNTHRLIKSSNLVITDFCMVGLEAMIARKPFLLYNPKNEPDIFDYKKGGVPEAKNDEELINLINKMIAEPDKYVQQTRNHVSDYDGNASKRIVGVIKDVLSKKNR